MSGVLLGVGADTEGFYTEVQEKILARYGKVFDWSLKAKMMGKKATESARIFVDECGLDGLLTPEQFLEERESMLQELFPSCAVLPGQGLLLCIYLPFLFFLQEMSVLYCLLFLSKLGSCSCLQCRISAWSCGQMRLCFLVIAMVKCL